MTGRESKKFQVGDKVISIKNTPEVPEGFVGYVVEAAKNDNYDYAVEQLGVPEYFNEDELELLSAGVHIPNDPDRDDITPQEIQGTHQSALDKQVSGNHYKDCGIQPIEYIHANNLSYLEGNVIKYTTRHSKKNGKQDILKAIHYLELILEMEYKGETN
jgi:hypothetical protein